MIIKRIKNHIIKEDKGDYTVLNINKNVVLTSDNFEECVSFCEAQPTPRRGVYRGGRKPVIKNLTPEKIKEKNKTIRLTKQQKQLWEELQFQKTIQKILEDKELAIAVKHLILSKNLLDKKLLAKLETI